MQSHYVWGAAVLAALALCSCGGPEAGDDGSGGATTGGTVGRGGPGNPSAGGTSSLSGSCAEPTELAGITVEHNALRSAVATDEPIPPLEWSCEVAAFAQTHVDELASLGCPLEHSNGPYGENTYWSSGPSTVQDAMRLWAAEAACYAYGAFPSQCSASCQTCGHYTQIIWRDSRLLGCGVAHCGDEKILVCNYDPPGNYFGEYPY